MLLLECDAKTLLGNGGIPTPPGGVARDETSLTRIIAAMPGPIVLKAQVAAGGRGKSGGIAFAQGRTEALDAFTVLKGKSIKGHVVDAVLVEERISFKCERYAGIAIDGGEISLLFAGVGGVDIEAITAADPSNFHAIRIDPIDGPSSEQLKECFIRLGYSPEYHPAYEDVARKLFTIFCACDATMLEINPLVELPDGKVLALDARVSIDDAALERQPAIAAMAYGRNAVVPSERSHQELRFKDNPEGGSIGLVGLGAGLNITLMDWIASAGAKAATVVDIDEAIAAGRAEHGFTTALQVFDQNPAVKSILINIITCGYRLDDIVAALVQALEKRPGGAAKPTILHLRGNCMTETPRMLAAAGQINCSSISSAIANVVAASRAR